MYALPPSQFALHSFPTPLLPRHLIDANYNTKSDWSRNSFLKKIFSSSLKSQGYKKTHPFFIDRAKSVALHSNVISAYAFFYGVVIRLSPIHVCKITTAIQRLCATKFQPRRLQVMKYKGDLRGKKIIATLRGQINDHSLGKILFSFIPFLPHEGLF